MLNNQKPEKRIELTNTVRSLDVHSIFKTIQGEGPLLELLASLYV